MKPTDGPQGSNKSSGGALIQGGASGSSHHHHHHHHPHHHHQQQHYEDVKHHQMASNDHQLNLSSNHRLRPIIWDRRQSTPLIILQSGQMLSGGASAVIHYTPVGGLEPLTLSPPEASASAAAIQHHSPIQLPSTTFLNSHITKLASILTSVLVNQPINPH